MRNEGEVVLPSIFYFLGGRTTRCQCLLTEAKHIDRSLVSDTIRFELERACWDPKDGELCLSRVKPGETLVEARSDTDVQIVHLTWV